MTALPKTVVIGHRTWKIKNWPPTKARNREGLCSFLAQTLFIRTKDTSPQQHANILVHEIAHAAWEEGGLSLADTEERIVTVFANVLTQVIRDNPDVWAYIEGKARS